MGTGVLHYSSIYYRRMDNNQMALLYRNLSQCLRKYCPFNLNRRPFLIIEWPEPHCRLIMNSCRWRWFIFDSSANFPLFCLSLCQSPSLLFPYFWLMCLHLLSRPHGCPPLCTTFPTQDWSIYSGINLLLRRSLIEECGFLMSDNCHDASLVRYIQSTQQYPTLLLLCF